MSFESHESALTAYREALAQAYETPPGAMAAEASPGGGRPVEDETKLSALEERSRAIGEETAALLESDHAGEREIAEGKLGALAVLDFAAASDLADRELGSEARTLDAEGPTTSAVSEALRDLEPVLQSTPATGLPLGDSPFGGAATLSAEEDAQAALRKAVPAAIDAVRDTARDSIKDGLTKLVAAELPIGEALQHLLDGAIGHLPARVGMFLKKAVALFRNGIEKLRKLFGKTFDAAVKKLKEWFGGVVTEDLLPALLDRIYGAAEIKRELDNRIENAGPGAPFAEVSDAIDGVVAKYGTQAKVLGWVFKAIAFCKRFILHLVPPPQGHFVIGAAFGLGVGYATYSGGDFIDWQRTGDDGFLDFVHGIRQSVEERIPLAG